MPWERASFEDTYEQQGGKPGSVNSPEVRHPLRAAINHPPGRDRPVALAEPPTRHHDRRRQFPACIHSGGVDPAGIDSTPP